MAPAAVAAAERELTGEKATGTVKFFNAMKGFGFIQRDDGQPDAFVHISAVERAGMTNLNEGDRLEFELEVDNRRGKYAAVNLTVDLIRPSSGNQGPARETIARRAFSWRAGICYRARISAAPPRMPSTATRAPRSRAPSGTRSRSASAVTIPVSRNAASGAVGPSDSA